MLFFAKGRAYTHTRVLCFYFLPLILTAVIEANTIFWEKQKRRMSMQSIVSEYDTEDEIKD